MKIVVEIVDRRNFRFLLLGENINVKKYWSRYQYRGPGGGFSTKPGGGLSSGPGGALPFRATYSQRAVVLLNDPIAVLESVKTLNLFTYRNFTQQVSLPPFRQTAQCGSKYLIPEIAFQ